MNKKYEILSFNEAVRSEKGSATLVVLAILSLISVTLITTTSLQNQIQGVEPRLNLKMRSQFARSYIRFLTRAESDCAISLTRDAIGLNLQDITASTTGNRDVKLNIINLKGDTEQILTKNSEFESVVIYDAHFTSLAQRAAGPDYIANLSLTFGHPADPVAAKTETIPFMFTTDGTGALLSCYSTSYVSGTSGYVLEDKICQLNKGSGYIYLPSTKQCVLDASTGLDLAQQQTTGP